MRRHALHDIPPLLFAKRELTIYTHPRAQDRSTSANRFKVTRGGETLARSSSGEHGSSAAILHPTLAQRSYVPSRPRIRKRDEGADIAWPDRAGILRIAERCAVACTTLAAAAFKQRLCTGLRSARGRAGDI